MTPRPARSVRLLCCGAALSACAAVVVAQEKKKEEDKTPRVIMCMPLAVTPGAATTLKLRGLRLAEATEVRVAGATATVKSKGKADAIQGAEPASVGDTQVEIELSVPADRPAGALPVVIVTPGGETRPYELTVVDAGSLVQEKEPNEGFRQGQELPVGKTVSGTVQSAEDVDVFRFDGKSGQTLVAEVTAARRGSQLDSLLTIYDAAGHTLATNDDASPGPEGEVNRDSLLSFQCPSDGAYFLALTDANARGGAGHAYLLTLKAAK